jgi:hypothetical protein
MVKIHFKESLETFFDELDENNIHTEKTSTTKTKNTSKNTSIDRINITKKKIYDWKGNETINYAVQIETVIPDVTCEFNIKTTSLIEKEEIEKQGIDNYVEKYLNEKKPDIHLYITTNKFGIKEKENDKRQLREIIKVNDGKISPYNSFKKYIGHILNKPIGDSIGRY